MQNNYATLGIGLILVALLTLLCDPFMLWMPPPAQTAVLLGVVLLLIAWAGFVLREKASDEREALHARHAGRVSYLAGLAVLTLALLLQGLAHDIDPWIVVALGTMVLTKLAAHWHLDRHC